MDGDRPPHAADKELQEEGAGDEGKGVWENVGRQNGAAKDAGDHHGQTPAEKGADVAQSAAADNSTHLADDADEGDACGVEFDLYESLSVLSLFKVLIV